ncbi:MAG: hypothetical protein QN144_13985 [Armatimonadota bacterium]|nr:hypothetical protein [Armatimonadota bacterium]
MRRTEWVDPVFVAGIGAAVRENLVSVALPVTPLRPWTSRREIQIATLYRTSGDPYYRWVDWLPWTPITVRP